MIEDEIVSIEYVGEEDTIDINVSGNRLFYANGILTHNSAVEEVEFDHSHISGGISKINTADNVFGIFTSRSMRENGKYQLQLMKTRSSNGVGHKIDLKFNVESLRIEDADPGSNTVIGSSNVNNVLGSIKRKSNNTSNVQQASPGAQVKSSKLNSLLKNIKSQGSEL